MLARRDTVAGRRITRRVDRLTEAATGVFSPSAADAYWGQGGVPFLWSHFEATTATANEPISEVLLAVARKSATGEGRR